MDADDLLIAGGAGLLLAYFLYSNTSLGVYGSQPTRQRQTQRPSYRPYDPFHGKPGYSTGYGTNYMPDYSLPSQSVTQPQYVAPPPGAPAANYNTQTVLQQHGYHPPHPRPVYHAPMTTPGAYHSPITPSPYAGRDVRKSVYQQATKVPTDFVQTGLNPAALLPAASLPNAGGGGGGDGGGTYVPGQSTSSGGVSYSAPQGGSSEDIGGGFYGGTSSGGPAANSGGYSTGGAYASGGDTSPFGGSYAANYGGGYSGGYSGGGGVFDLQDF